MLPPCDWGEKNSSGYHAALHGIVGFMWFWKSCSCPDASHLPLHWPPVLPLFLTGFPSPFWPGLVPLAPCQRAYSFPGENQPTNLKFSNEPVRDHQSSVPVSMSISVLWYMVSKCCWFLRAWSRGSPGSPAHSATLSLIYNLADTTRCWFICLKWTSTSTEVFGSSMN